MQFIIAINVGSNQGPIISNNKMYVGIVVFVPMPEVGI